MMAEKKKKKDIKYGGTDCNDGSAVLYFILWFVD